jgi:hypothetical protein
MMCKLWNILDQETNPSDAKNAAMAQIRTEIGCTIE